MGGPASRSDAIVALEMPARSTPLYALLALTLLSACASTWRGSIGAVLAQDRKTGRLTVREAPADMGAARAGIVVGDEVVAIDGEAAKEMKPEGIHQKLEGDVGSKVRLLVKRGTELKEVTVERGPLREAK